MQHFILMAMPDFKFMFKQIQYLCKKLLIIFLICETHEQQCWEHNAYHNANGGTNQAQNQFYVWYQQPCDEGDSYYCYGNPLET